MKSDDKDQTNKENPISKWTITNIVVSLSIYALAFADYFLLRGSEYRNSTIVDYAEFLFGWSYVILTPVSTLTALILGRRKILNIICNGVLFVAWASLFVWVYTWTPCL